MVRNVKRIANKVAISYFSHISETIHRRKSCNSSLERACSLPFNYIFLFDLDIVVDLENLTLNSF